MQLRADQIAELRLKSTYLTQRHENRRAVELARIVRLPSLRAAICVLEATLLGAIHP